MSDSKKEEILNRMLDDEQLKGVSGGCGAITGIPIPANPDCKVTARRNDCDSTVEIGSWCKRGDACVHWSVIYSGCQKEEVNADA